MSLTLRSQAPTLFKARRDKFLGSAGGLAVVFGMGSALGAGSKSHGALRFLTGWDGYEASSLLMMRGEACKLLLSSPFMLPLAAETVPELSPIYLPMAEWAAAFNSFFDQEIPGWVGADELPAIAFRELAAKIHSGSDLTSALGLLRLQKDDAALSLHRVGAGICDRMYESLPQRVKIGKPIWQIQREIEANALLEGADYCKTWMTIRSAADRPRYWPEENRDVVREGSQFLMGIALTLDGHWAHAIRMGYIGCLDPRHEAFHLAALHALEAGVVAMEVGNDTSAPMRAMSISLQKSGYDAMYGASKSFRSGHGLGLSYEDPVLTDFFPQTFGVAAKKKGGESGALSNSPAENLLKPGMLFELHPNLFYDGVGGAALGDMVLVTEQGPEIMTKFPRDLMHLGL